MGLIFRRFLASLINGIIIFISFTLISVIFAFWLFFSPYWIEIDLKWFFLIFAISFSVMGNLKVGLLTKLGGKIAGIQLHETNPKPNKYIKVLIRITFFYFFAFISIIIYNYYFNVLFKTVDLKIQYILFPFTSLGLFFLILVIPISIIIGKGIQGIHDVISNLSVSTKEDAIGELTSPKKGVATRSIVTTFIVSIIATSLMLYLMINFNIHKNLFDMSYGEGQNKLEKIIEKIDLIIPSTPIRYRSYEIFGGIKWWVDLKSDDHERNNFNKIIGIKGVDALGLLGYGFYIEKSKKDILLLNIDNDKKRLIPENTNMITCSIHVDKVIFYPELMDKVFRYFIKNILSSDISTEVDVICLKAIYSVKVGNIHAGVFDEYFITRDRQAWRKKNIIDYPIFVNIWFAPIENYNIFDDEFK